MLHFEKDNQRFNMRAAGVCVQHNHVLLHQSDRDDFWSLPGGRVEWQEATHDTLKREMREELNVTVQVSRLLWVVENFFPYDHKTFHELGFYYLMQLPGNSTLNDTTRTATASDGPLTLTFRWFALNALPERLYPSFLTTSLAALPDVTTHLIHHDS